MRISDKLCEQCFGISRKRLNWNGKEVCEQCYCENIKESLDKISEAKRNLAELVSKLEDETGKQIYFGIDDDTDMHVQRGLEWISKALDKKPYKEINYVGAPTTAVNGDGVRFSYTDWGRLEDVN